MAVRRQSDTDGERLSPAQRARLRALLDALPEGCNEGDPALFRLLNYFDEIHDTYPRPTIQAARVHGGWLVGSVESVVGALRHLAEES